MADRIEVTVPGCKGKFEEWIATRGGVRVWKNANLSNPGAGDMYAPERDKDGNTSGKPHWSVEQGGLFTDISAFRFIKELKEVKRFRVAIRASSNGMMFKCTDGSTRRIRKACAAVAKSNGGVEPTYHFDYDTQECVIELPVFED